WETFDAGKLEPGRLVAVGADESILGWVAASLVSTREVYRGVVEHSVYVSAHARGQGAGRALLGEFLRAMDAAGFWTVQSSIFPENLASLALHD
ncbi:N-acetyltransferase family protein, partial [Enterobacter hormaechei]